MKTLLRFLFVLTSLSLLQAQDTPARKDHPTKVFKVTYNIYELEDGKKINERSYTLPVRTVGDNAPRQSTLKIGTRVPVTVKDGGVTYLDVGMMIECDVTEQAEKFIVFTGMEMTYIMSSDPGTAPGMPVLRGIKENSTTMVGPGKPTLVTSIDDINSKKRTQVEVTVTKIE